MQSLTITLITSEEKPQNKEVDKNVEDDREVLINELIDKVVTESTRVNESSTNYEVEANFRHNG